MMGIARGAALIISNGIPIYGLDERYRFIGQGKIFDVIPVPTVIVLVVYAICYLVLNHSRFGRFVYAIGSNEEAARLSGINVTAVTIGIYAICGLLSGLASTIEAGRLATVQPAGGNGYELLAIGAVVVGGTSLFGGEGSIIATLIGALMVTTIRNGLNILGVNAFWQYVVNGLVIIAAVAVDQYRRKQ
jgi:ribose transport system permease protein